MAARIETSQLQLLSGAAGTGDGGGAKEIYMHEGVQTSWFALSTKRNRERMIGEMLRGKGFEEFVPLYRSRRKWSDRYKDLELPLFPGYVFCRFDPTRRLPVLTTPGVFAIVGNGRMPVPVEDFEMAALRAVVASNLRTEPWPFLRVGQRVAIETGSLAGLEGILQEVRKTCRLVVSVNLLQRSVAVEVDRNWVRPLGIHPALARTAGAGSCAPQ